MQSSKSILETAVKRLARVTPTLPEEVLQTFVRRFTQQRDTFVELVQNHGTPLYVYDRSAFQRRIREFVSAFEDSPSVVHVFYAVKSNNHPLIAETAVKAGLGLDVSSGLELEMAIRCKCHKILFSGPGKTLDELRLATDYADRVTVLVDSFGELERLNAVAASIRMPVRIGVRICTEESGLWKKFGIPLDRLDEFLQKSSECKNLRLEGLQFHTSWNLDPGKQTAFIRRLGKQLGVIESSKLASINFIDIGGGFWPPQGEWLQEAETDRGRIGAALTGNYWPSDISHYRLEATSIEQFATAIVSAFKANIEPYVKCDIYTEPGRWLCNDAVHILLTVVDRKAEDVVITDGGTNAVGWERFESDFFPVINLSRSGTEEHQCAVYGSLCSPHDIWGYSYFGSGIERGDILLVPTQGAYTYSLRQQFIKPLPSFVVMTPADDEAGTTVEPKSRRLQRTE
jgi:diaminopimelate decarboxylase